VTKAPPIEECRLCGKVSQLKNGHVLPSWGYERAHWTPKEGRSDHLVWGESRTGNVLYGEKPITEYLLCEGCEHRFCLDEDYASRVLVQKDGSFPWFDRVRSRIIDRWLVDSSAMDADALVRFAVSVVWRAGVCSKLPVQLGPYRRPIGEFLLGNRALTSEAHVVAKLLENDEIRRCLVPPQAEKREAGDLYWFIVCGVMFQVWICAPPSPLAEVCLAQRRRALLGQDADVHEMLARAVGTMAPKGALARDIAVSRG
jgi:hypothetical protein